MLQMQALGVFNDRDHIKTAGAVPGRMRIQPVLGRPHKGPPLARGHGVRRAGLRMGTAAFYFHENKGVAVTADNVQFQPALPPVLVQQHIALALQQGCGCRFPPLSQCRPGLCRGGGGLRGGLQHNERRRPKRRRRGPGAGMRRG